jgi:hypothetical protein
MSVTESQHESVLVAHSPDDCAGAHLDTRICGQLLAAHLVELCRLASVVSEKTTDARRRQVALVAVVDDQSSPPGAAEHQGGAEPCSAATHDHAIPRISHAASLPGTA